MLSKCPTASASHEANMRAPASGTYAHRGDHGYPRRNFVGEGRIPNACQGDDKKEEADETQEHEGNPGGHRQCDPSPVHWSDTLTLTVRSKLGRPAPASAAAGVCDSG